MNSQLPPGQFMLHEALLVFTWDTHAMKGEFPGSNDFEVLAFMVVVQAQYSNDRQRRNE